MAVVVVNDNELKPAKTGLTVGNIEIESSSGFEAGIATFHIYGCYNKIKSCFEFKNIKKYVLIGSQVSIRIGYDTCIKEVFCGFISQVNFFFQEDEIPGVKVTCMDVKGIMMANCYSKQMTATSYSEAVKEIFNQDPYADMKTDGIIKSLNISDTPDKADLASGALGGLADMAGVGDLADAVMDNKDLISDVASAAETATNAVSSVAGGAPSGAAGALTGMADSLTGGAASSAMDTVSSVTNAAGGAIEMADQIGDTATAAMNTASQAADALGGAASQLNQIAGAANIPGVGAVPGVPGMTTDKSVEMVAESDYEFVVKAAKKFNYEFFVSAGNVYFRKAKDYDAVLMEVSPSTGMRNIDVEYNVTGLVGKVEVRSTDVAKATQIASSKKLSNKISKGSKASKLVKEAKKVYIDPTADSKKNAGYRADYLAEEIAYRYGTLEAEFTGLPDLVVGRFIKLVNMGDPVNNLFYVTNVRHIMNGERGYTTKIVAKAAGLGGSYSTGTSSLGGLGALGGALDAVNDAMDMASDAFDTLDDMTGGMASELAEANADLLGGII